MSIMMFWRFLLCLLFGALLPLSFAPFNLYSVAFFSPAFLLYFWLKSTPRQAMLQGFLFAFGNFGVGISWIYISIHYFGNTSPFLAIFLTLFVIVLMSLHFAIFGYLFRKGFQKKSIVIQCVLVFPALWVLMEWVNTAILGFPWLLLGYSQLTTPLRGLAPIIGVYGLSLSVAMISGAMVLLAVQQQFRTHLLCFGIVILWIGTGFLFQHYLWTAPVGNPFKTSLIQGNIPQSIKWDPNFALHNINVYYELTLKQLNSQLIIWPEGALPVTAEDVPQLIDQLSQLAKQGHTTLIFGTTSKHKSTNRYYNAIFMLGQNEGHYLKRHLVPFGEFTPFPYIIKPLAEKFHIDLSDLSEGPKSQPPLQFNSITIAPFICYEVTFPELVLNSAENTEVLLTVSDDSWFGRSIALAQHLQMAQMRSLEMGRYMLLATNTGITAIISAQGNLVVGAPIDTQTVITHDVVPMNGKTPLMRWHYYPLFVIIGLMLFVGLLWA